MKKLAIIEKNHFEVAFTLLQLFDRPGLSITVYTYPVAYEELCYMLQEKAKKYEWVVKDNEESNRAFIERIFQHIKEREFDTIYANTIEDNFVLYAHHLRQLHQCRIILTLHMINEYFKFQPALAIRRLVRSYGKRRLMQAVNEFTVLSEEQARYLSEQLKEHHAIHTIPGSFFDMDNYRRSLVHAGETWRIVVPGSIDERRRNYDEVFRLLELAEQASINVSVTLLGGRNYQYSDAVIKRCEEWKSTHDNLRYFDHAHISQVQFDQELQSSHFIWIPLREKTIISDGIVEEYGRTICSGNIGDIIRHAKPFIAPQHLTMDMALSSAAIRYQQPQDLIQLIASMNNESYRALADKALQAATYYTSEKIKERNPSLFR